MISYWWGDRPFTKETCEEIIGHFKEPQKGKTEGNKISAIRESQVMGIPFGHPLWGYMKSICDPIVEQANNHIFGFDVNLNCVEFQIAKYDKNCHYDTHMDLRLTKEMYARKLSVTVQLSELEDYEGGELVFNNTPAPPKELKEQGSMIIFPSFISHAVTGVTKGTRYSLVAWYGGPLWK